MTNKAFVELCNRQKEEDKLRRHRLVKAGLIPNRLLGETIAPIVHAWWIATEPGKPPMSDNKDYET